MARQYSQKVRAVRAAKRALKRSK